MTILVLATAESLASRVSGARVLLQASNDRTDLSTTLLDRARKALATGDAIGAAELLNQAKAGATDAKTRAVTAAFLGVAQVLRGDLERGGEAWETAIADPALDVDAALDALEFVVLARLAAGESLARQAAKRAEGSQSHGRALSLFAIALETAGRYDDARETHEAAIEAAKVASPAGRASVLWRAAGWFKRRGDLDAALRLLDEANEAGVSDTLAVRIRGDLGAIYVMQGKYGRARAKFEEVLLHAQREGDASLLLAAQKGLAEVEALLGNPEGALELRQRIVAATPAGTTKRAQHEQDVGTVLEALGRHDEARAVYEQAASVFDAAGLPRDGAMARINLGRVLRVDGNPTQALAVHERALELAQAAKDARLEAAAACGIADDWIALGDGSKARRAGSTALALVREVGAIDHEIYVLESLIAADLLAGEADDAEEHLAEVDRLLDRPEVASLGRMDAAGVRSRFHRLGDLAQDLCTLRSVNEQTDRATVAGEALSWASRWKGRALLEGRKGHAIGATELYPADWRERFERALANGGIFVEFVAGRTELFAIVVTGESLTRVDLGPRVPLESLSRSYLARVRGFDPNAQSLLADGHALYRALVAPVLAAAEVAPNSIVIVPSLELSGIPFESLVVAPGADFVTTTFFGDSLPVSYAPSGPAFLSMTGRSRNGSTKSLLVAVAEHELRPDLPETWIEVQAVSRLLLNASGADADCYARLARLDSDSARFESSHVLMLCGEEATWDAMKLLDGDYRFMHFATHAEADLTDPGRTAVFVAPSGDHDGSVTIADIASLRARADIVFLACCETAAGKPSKGEGISSLANAFLTSGSDAVIATLWPVQDERMPALATTFYEEALNNGASPAVALRAARATLRVRPWRGKSPIQDGRVDHTGHPYFWASCILIGRGD